MERPPWHERCRTGLEAWFKVLAGYRALALSTGLVVYFAVAFGEAAREQLAAGNAEGMAVLTERMIYAGLVYVAARLGTGIRATGLGLYNRFSSGMGSPSAPLDDPYDDTYGPDPEARP